MKRGIVLVVAAALAGGLAGCGGEAAHVSAGLLAPDPHTPVPDAPHDPANAGMMDATPPLAGRRRAD